MKRVIYSKELKLTNTCIAIGKFDGIHKGHSIIIDWLKNSKDKGYTSVIITFQKVDKGIFNVDNHKFILTDEEKYKIYEEKGIDYVIECPITEELISTDKEDFLREILIEQFGMKQIVCGSDFRFGYKREGDVNYLLEEADRYGYLVKVFDKLQENSAIISSTRIRHLIEEGNVEEANKLLNHPYRIKGKVIHGNEIGRTLNYPTANVVSEVDKILPAKGVYFTKTYYNGKLYDSITNVGNRPTVVDDNKIVIETHILDFEGEIYDEYIEILFYMYHRKEQKFSSCTELAENLKKDAVIRRKYQFA